MHASLAEISKTMEMFLAAYQLPCDLHLMVFQLILHLIQVVSAGLLH